MEKQIKCWDQGWFAALVDDTVMDRWWRGVVPGQDGYAVSHEERDTWTYNLTLLSGLIKQVMHRDIVQEVGGGWSYQFMNLLRQVAYYWRYCGRITPRYNKPHKLNLWVLWGGPLCVTSWFLWLRFQVGVISSWRFWHTSRFGHKGPQVLVHRLILIVGASLVGYIALGRVANK